MILQEDDLDGRKETFNVRWIDVEKSLNALDNKNKGYIVLSDDSNSYLQCAGRQERLVIEFRKYSSGDFKHYVIGIGELKSPLKSVWTSVNCKVGPITVLNDEVLTINEAKELFRGFYESSGISASFKKRNVTKLHKS